MSRAPRTLTANEQLLLLSAFEKGIGTARKRRRAIRNYAMVVLMLDAGLRVGELVKLRIKDLVFDGKPVNNLVMNAEITKNHVERIIPLSERAKSALGDMLCYWWVLPVQVGSRWAFYGSVCGIDLTPRQVERIVRAAAIRAFGRPIHPHILRHTFATRLMRVTDMRTVQQLLGHKSITSTQVYTHPNGDDLKTAIDAL